MGNQYIQKNKHIQVNVRGYLLASVGGAAVLIKWDKEIGADSYTASTVEAVLKLIEACKF